MCMRAFTEKCRHKTRAEQEAFRPFGQRYHKFVKNNSTRGFGEGQEVVGKWLGDNRRENQGKIRVFSKFVCTDQFLC